MNITLKIFLTLLVGVLSAVAAVFVLFLFCLVSTFGRFLVIIACYFLAFGWYKLVVYLTKKGYIYEF